MDLAWIGMMFFCCLSANVYGLPDLRNTPSDPIIVRMSDEAVLPCIVKDVENFTVIWKRFRFGRAEVLTANSIKVTSDPRFSIIHNEEGNKWVLTISDVRLSDTAQYVCEINSDPAIQMSRFVTVTPPQGIAIPLNHNYTSCCILKGVSPTCIGYCNLQNILLGTTGATPQRCREFLPSIAGCMADGRNHMPCCLREKIPEVCRDVCVGKFGLLNETIVNHYTCSRYSRLTLGCIAEGIELLPGRPRRLKVEPISAKEIKVQWLPPLQNADTITYYTLNITEMKSFDDRDKATWDLDHELNSTTNSTNELTSRYTEISINVSATSTVVKNLKPFTMYEMYLVSGNSYGTSLPTYSVRTMTLLRENSSTTVPFNDNITLPELPDIRGCCESKGMTQERCLDLFCDPVKADVTSLTDMMICAPWINTSVTCLVGDKDHTDCCRQRGLPELCIPLCKGKVERIDYRYFRCVAYMNSYTSCLMQGYGVLPSAPKDLILKTIHSSWAILQWSPPDLLSSTVKSYNVHYKLLEDDQTMYRTIKMAKSPFLLDNLKPDTKYEAYVRAVNKYGTSESSPSVIIETLPVKEEELIEETAEIAETNSSYNLRECCNNAKMNSSCMPLCSFQAKMSDLHKLSTTCTPEFHKLLKCAVGGRNHVPCCMRRLVSADCTSLCAGMVPQMTTALAAMCIPYVPDIIMCLEEGSVLLPGPVHELHAFILNDSTVALEWSAPVESNVTHYEVRFQGMHADESKEISDPIPDKSMNVTETTVTISTLQPNVLYSFYVLAVNEYGASIPSSILSFNTSNIEDAVGLVSPPHALTVRNKNTTSMLLTWLPPDFSHPSDSIIYRVYHKQQNETSFSNFTTTSLMAFLSDLLPDTEYFVYVTASTEAGESWPSEKLRVWTDPVFPAFVQMPSIHPSTQIEEGSSMTVLCVATGAPVPKMGIYISGKKIFEEVTRHLVARISNISRDMNIVTCTADNGYGVGSQATRRIKITYPPTLEARNLEMVSPGETVFLECVVDGFPKPQVSWWRDEEKMNPVKLNLRIDSRISQEEESDVLQLIIHEVTEADTGVYYCSAQNPYGSVMDKINLQLAETPDISSNVSSCCIQQKVDPDCMDACTYDVDIEAVIHKDHCIPDLHKLIYCAADGSDHRRCCQTWGIPKRCIGLCQGKQIPQIPICVLAWTKQIVSCFQEGKRILPSVPENFHATVLSSTSVLLEWDPPSKNPQTVQFYRVFGRPISQRKSAKFQNETHGLSLIMTRLKPGGNYEFVIKAGNHYGASVVSDPIKVQLIDGEVVEAVIETHADNTVAIVVGITLSVIMVAVATVAYIYFKRKCRPPPTNGVSFENPSYMREVTNDSTQGNGMSSDQQLNGGSFPTDSTWKTETLHTPDYDNLYEVPADDKSNLRKNQAKNSFL